MFEALKVYCSNFLMSTVEDIEIFLEDIERKDRVDGREYTSNKRQITWENAASFFRCSGLSENLYWLHERRKKRVKTGNAVEIKTNILTSESDQRRENIKKEAWRNKNHSANTSNKSQTTIGLEERAFAELCEDKDKGERNEWKKYKFDFPHIFQLCFQL